MLEAWERWREETVDIGGMGELSRGPVAACPDATTFPLVMLALLLPCYCPATDQLLPSYCPATVIGPGQESS